jgi:hypothetical protein
MSRLVIVAHALRALRGRQLVLHRYARVPSFPSTSRASRVSSVRVQACVSKSLWELVWNAYNARVEDSQVVFADFDIGDFWEDSDYARKKYVEGPITPELVRSIEEELGLRLPPAYVALMASQNGGIPTRTCFPTKVRTTWAENHIAITGFLGIGREKTYSLLGSLGSKFMQEEWGYPDFGFCICDCPSAGHDMVMLDYRECGPEGEPVVVHVDQEDDYRVTFLAPNFEAFVRGLVPASDYDTSEEDLARELDKIKHGAFSTALTRLLASAPSGVEGTLRRLLGDCHAKGLLCSSCGSKLVSRLRPLV